MSHGSRAISADKPAGRAISVDRQPDRGTNRQLRLRALRVRRPVPTRPGICGTAAAPATSLGAGHERMIVLDRASLTPEQKLLEQGRGRRSRCGRSRSGRTNPLRPPCVLRNTVRIEFASPLGSRGALQLRRGTVSRIGDAGRAADCPITDPGRAPPETGDCLAWPRAPVPSSPGAPVVRRGGRQEPWLPGRRPTPSATLGA